MSYLDKLNEERADAHRKLFVETMLNELGFGEFHTFSEKTLQRLKEYNALYHNPGQQINDVELSDEGDNLVRLRIGPNFYECKIDK